MMTTGNDTNEVDLHDVLKQRVEAGEPIYLAGPATAATKGMIDRLAEETRRTVSVVRVIDRQATLVESTAPETVDHGLANGH